MSDSERHLRRRGCTVALIFVGAVLVFGAGWLASELWAKGGPTYVLVRELDADAAYGFKGDAPVRGVLKPGTKIHVTMHKGTRWYVTLKTVLHEKHFLEASERE